MNIESFLYLEQGNSIDTSKAKCTLLLPSLQVILKSTPKWCHQNLPHSEHMLSESNRGVLRISLLSLLFVHSSEIVLQEC